MNDIYLIAAVLAGGVILIAYFIILRANVHITRVIKTDNVKTDFNCIHSQAKMSGFPERRLNSLENYLIEE